MATEVCRGCRAPSIHQFDSRNPTNPTNHFHFKNALNPINRYNVPFAPLN